MSFFAADGARRFELKPPKNARDGALEVLVPIVTMRELLEAGVHYGHHTSRWNPKMAKYVYKRRHSIHVIDLRETVRGLVRACRFLAAIAEQGGEFILVGTKRQARRTVEEQAARAGIHHVSERWLGGTLTNFHIVMSRLKRLKELEQLDQSGEIESKGKKLASVLRRELAKLRKNLGGIRDMKRLPDALIIIDPRRERSALREAYALGIPSICILDTDSDPEMVDIIIPGNDDAMRSIQLLCSKLIDAVLEGRAERPLEAEELEPVAVRQPATAPASVPAPAQVPTPHPAEPSPGAGTATAAASPETAPLPPHPAPEPPTRAEPSA